MPFKFRKALQKIENSFSDLSLLNFSFWCFVFPQKITIAQSKIVEKDNESKINVCENYRKMMLSIYEDQHKKALHYKFANKQKQTNLTFPLRWGSQQFELLKIPCTLLRL